MKKVLLLALALMAPVYASAFGFTEFDGVGVIKCKEKEPKYLGWVHVFYAPRFFSINQEGLIDFKGVTREEKHFVYDDFIGLERISFRTKGWVVSVESHSIIINEEPLTTTGVFMRKGGCTVAVQALTTVY